MIKEKYQIILVIITVFLILFLGTKLITSSKEKAISKVKNGEYKYTIGVFNKVSKSGNSGPTYIHIVYTVNDIEYKVSTISDEYYTFCKYRDCTDKKFWIIYLISDPSQALVNITNEIQNVENPIPPTNIDNFTCR